MYSNVALVLALLHIGILLSYRYYARQFGNATKSLLSGRTRLAKPE